MQKVPMTQIETAKIMAPVTFFIKAIGRGKTLGRHLTYSEACEAMERVLLGHFSNAQLGAFLQALRIRELSTEELLAFAEIFYARSLKMPSPEFEPELCVNLCFDSSRKTNLLTMLCLPLLESLGIQSGLVCSVFPLTGQSQLITQSLNLARVWAQKQGYPCTSLDRICWVPQTVSGLEALNQVRSEIGFRSCLHTVEKLFSPWPQALLCTGLSHPQYLDRFLEVLDQVHKGPGVVVLGQHGTIDLSFQKETPFYTSAQRTRALSELPEPLKSESAFVTWAHHGKLDDWEKPGALQTDLAQKAIALQAGFFLFLCGKVRNTEEGYHVVMRRMNP